MKKILAIVLTVAMLLSMSTVVAVAADSEFEAVGKQQITWDPDATEKIELDGDISDWREAEYSSVQVTLNNVLYFDHVPFQSFPEDWALNIYYVSDADNLYVAFSVVDADLQPMPAGTSVYSYVNFDCFQIAIDFNAQIERWETETPGYCEDLGGSPESIFYSFAYAGDKADLTLVRQNKLGAANIVETLTEAEGAWGMSGATENGWCAEFALSWDMLYRDFAFKTYGDGYTAKVNPEDPLQLGILLSCFDATSAGPATAGGNGVVGTFKNADDKASDEITPLENGLYLQLPYQRGLEINCDGIEISESAGDQPGDQPGESKPGEFNVLDKMNSFIDKHKVCMDDQDCDRSITEDGAIRVTAWTRDQFSDETQTSTVAHLDVNYSRLMSAYYTGFTATGAVQKLNELPNANVETPYTVVALKVKRSETIRNQDMYMWYSMGNNGTPSINSACYADIGIPAAGDEYEYFLFNLADYDDFQDDYINTLRFFWIDDQISENTEGATMDIYAINLYTTMDEAVADLQLTGVESSFDDDEPEDSESETDDETDDETVGNNAGANPTETSGSDDEGCGSVIGAGAAAVVLSAVAAAVVLKKKEY